MDSSAKIGCLHATLLGGRRKMSKMSRRASKTSKTGIACANMDHSSRTCILVLCQNLHTTYLCIGKMRRGPRSWQVARLASFRWRRCVNSCVRVRAPASAAHDQRDYLHISRIGGSTLAMIVSCPSSSTPCSTRTVKNKGGIRARLFLLASSPAC